MNDQFLIVANLFICSAGGVICLCRMSKMSHSRTKLEIRWQYAIWFSLLTASGWSFILGDVVDTVQLFMSCGIVGALAIGVPVWRHDVPRYAEYENGQR